MTKKMFRAILLVTTTVLVISILVITGVLYKSFGDAQRQQLEDELSFAALATEQNGIEYLAEMESSHFRLTWVDEDGSVLFDNQAEADKMENHKEREEIREAIRNGRGSSSRNSETLMENTLYEAVRLSDGTVLRISVDQKTAFALLLRLIRPFIIILIVAVCVSMWLAKHVAKQIMEPLNQIDLEEPLEDDAYEELAPLLNRIHNQQQQISDQIRDLKQQKKEFKQVTDNMKESLVLLDNHQRVLSINPAAMGLFQTTDECVGKDFLAIERKSNVSSAIEQAMIEGHSEIRTEKNGREYQFDITRIDSAGESVGAVILAFDITEQSNAERMRREFSANVSHELKTPLQSIIGSAELMENGLVKEEDTPRFIGNIRKEAARLVALIEDIMRLSQLDEGNEMTREEVSLQDIVKEAFFTLDELAVSRDISLELYGTEGRMVGVHRLLYEIIYNLCDNAIKYNVDGGRVSVSVCEDENECRLIVRDTGVGIPPEHQARVFERFYRVDKSHSKKSGGTGLGLSIVKHAVQYHHGKIELESEEQMGTTIQVRFPK